MKFSVRCSLTIVGDIALVDGHLLQHVRTLVANALKDGQLEHLLEAGLGRLAALRAANDDHLLERVA